jgi:predicted Zn-dependent peptidase
VKGYERKQLLERLDRAGSTVGVDIPERITVQGEPVDLREFVFEIKRRESIPPGERERVDEAKSNLRRERLQRRQRVEDEEMDYETAEAVVESILGIDRALNALESLGPTDLEKEARQKEVADRKRWMSFLKQVLGRDDGSGGRAGP